MNPGGLKEKLGRGFLRSWTFDARESGSGLLRLKC